MFYMLDFKNLIEKNDSSPIIKGPRIDNTYMD